MDTNISEKKEEEADTTKWSTTEIIIKPSLQVIEPFKKKSYKRNNNRARKNNKTGFCGFGKVTKKNLKTPKGWKNLFEGMLYIIPCLIKKVGVRMAVLSKGSEKETTHDQTWFVNSCFEFCYIFIAYLFANVLFFYVYIEKLRSLHYGLNATLYYFVKLLLFLPDVIYVGIHDVIPFFFKKFGLHITYEVNADATRKEGKLENISSVTRGVNAMSDYASNLPGVQTFGSLVKGVDGAVGNVATGVANAAQYATNASGVVSAAQSFANASGVASAALVKGVDDAVGNVVKGTKYVSDETVGRLASGVANAAQYAADKSGLAYAADKSGLAKAAQSVANASGNVAQFVAHLGAKNSQSSKADVHYACSFLVLFMICYILVYFLLDKFGKMFLQVFDYKADKTVILFIIGSWVYYMFYSVFDYFKMGFMGPVTFMIGQFLYLCVSIMLAPIGQMIFVIYFFYVFTGNGYTLDAIRNTKWFSNLDLFKLVDDKISEQNEDENTFLGTMNAFIQTNIYKYFLLVITMLFFFYKIFESSITLKVTNFKWYFTVLNVIICAGLGYLYSVYKMDPGTKELGTVQRGGASLSATSILTGFGFVGLVFVIPMSVILAKYK